MTLTIIRSLLFLSLASHLSANTGLPGETLITADAYSIGNGFTDTSHATGSHFHSSNLDTLPPGNPEILVKNVAEVGGFFGDEEVRGLVEFPLAGLDVADEATLLFDVFDVSDLAGMPIGGLFGQTALDGTIDVLAYYGNGVEEVSDFQVSPLKTIHTIDVTTLAASDTISVDITDLYNDAVILSQAPADPPVAAIGFRLQVSSTVDASDPDTGAATFSEFRILTVPEPTFHWILLIGLGLFVKRRRCRKETT